MMVPVVLIAATNIDSKTLLRLRIFAAGLLAGIGIVEEATVGFGGFELASSSAGNAEKWIPSEVIGETRNARPRRAIMETRAIDGTIFVRSYCIQDPAEAASLC